jgi:hypothetical protein
MVRSGETTPTTEPEDTIPHPHPDRLEPPKIDTNSFAASRGVDLAKRGGRLIVNAQKKNCETSFSFRSDQNWLG